MSSITPSPYDVIRILRNWRRTRTILESLEDDTDTDTDSTGSSFDGSFGSIAQASVRIKPDPDAGSARLGAPLAAAAMGGFDR